jgi:hypothetical protein
MRVLLTALAALAATTATSAMAQGSQPGVPNPEAARTQGQTGATAPTAADVADIQVSQIYVYGDDPCPASTNPSVINVCARLPSGDRFRIPQNLRSDPNDPENQAWTNRAIELSYVGASGIGSCSPTGPGGFIGCQQQLINQAVAERRGRPEVNWARLIEEARQERLAGINRAAAEAEAEGADGRRVQQLQIQTGQMCPPSTEAVILVCTYPDGSRAPTQPAGEPQLPVGGRAAPAPATAPQRPN